MADQGAGDTLLGIEITIDDEGLRIPENEVVYVFEPLYRLESSRNRETGEWDWGSRSRCRSLELTGGGSRYQIERKAGFER